MISKPPPAADPSAQLEFDGAVIAGAQVPIELLGRLNETPDWRRGAAELPALLARDGYVLLRGALSREAVLVARREVLLQLAVPDLL